MTEISFKQRFSALRNLPRFFALVWQASPSLTILNVSLRIFRSALPVSILYVGKLIIDKVALLSQDPAQSYSDHLWKLIGIEVVLVILSDFLNRATSLVDSLLGDLFSNATSIKIMQHAATLDIEQFEDSAFYDKLERARQQTVGRTILLSQLLSQVQDLITIGFLAVGLIVLNSWLIVMLFIAILPAFISNKRATFLRTPYVFSRFIPSIKKFIGKYSIQIYSHITRCHLPERFFRFFRHPA